MHRSVAKTIVFGEYDQLNPDKFEKKDQENHYDYRRPSLISACK